jgi:hypothetical protein
MVDLVEGLPGMPMPIIVGPTFERGREFSDHLKRRFGTTW